MGSTPKTRIDRFGGYLDNGIFKDRGGFVSSEGALFSSRALPAKTRLNPYNAYRILKPIEVDSGPAIPWFGDPGMGIQYELPENIDKLKRNKSIKLVKAKYSPSEL